MGRKGIQIQTLDEVNGATQTYATHTGSSSELTCVGKPTLEYAIQVKKATRIQTQTKTRTTNKQTRKHTEYVLTALYRQETDNCNRSKF